MRLAPDVTFDAVASRTYSSGLRGVMQTLAAMRAMVKAGRTHPAIRRAATGIVFTTPEKDAYSECEALFLFVRDHVRYTQDVLDVETLTTPDKTLAAMMGDCDDQVMLLAALMESTGYPTRFVVAGYSDPSHVEHVYMQVLCNGAWLDCDPTEVLPFGAAPPDPSVVYIERV